jgi:hypothetical protein
MVARGWGVAVTPGFEPCEQDAGDHEGPPNPTQPRSPLRMFITVFVRQISIMYHEDCHFFRLQPDMVV